MQLRHRLKRLEAEPGLVLARLLPELNRVRGDDAAYTRWLGTLSIAELEAIVSMPCDGDLEGLTDDELQRMVDGELPEAVLGAEAAKSRGLL